MSMFGDLMHKIFHAGSPVAAAAPVTAETPATPDATPAVAAAPAEPVDVDAVLTKLAGEKGGTYNWQVSIVDLLRLLDMDSSLAARKELANELNIHVGADGTAEENVALHKAVMQKLAENGGKVPDSLKH